jgi:hypothetical protein
MTPLAPQRDDPLGDELGVLVLPHTLDVPPLSGQRRVDSTITLDVPLQLRGPVLDVGLRDRAVLGATMPEAPVDEHRDARLRQNHVDPHALVSDRDPHVLAEAEAASVQR